MKSIKDFFANKPWRAWVTRKFAFVYSLIFGTILIIVAAIAMFMGIDSASFLDVALSFPQWVVTTGAAITIIKTVKSKNGDE